MSINCANITSKEYNKLKAKFGEDKANYLWNKLNGTIPEDISKLIPIEFKKAQVLIPHNLVKTLGENGIDVYKLTHEELQKVVSPEVLEGLSYRIPNQAAASNDSFEIVGILPENAGDTIIAFKEITTKTGSDFDIDKAFIILPNYYYDEKTKRLEIHKDDSKEGLENRRLSIANKMLSTIPNYIKLMKPLDTKWLENLVFGTKEKVGLFNNDKKAQDLDFFTGINQVKTKSTFDNGKALVGPIAKTMTNHNAVKHEGIKWSKWFIGKGIFEETTEETIIEETAPTNILNENGTIVNRFAEEVDAKYELFPGVFANQGQREALDKITEFLDSSEPEFLLMGKGGTGKTTIIKKILDKLPKEKVIGIAPSHKAKKVLAKSINTKDKTYKTTTLASALAIKLNENTGTFEPDEYARKKGSIPIKRFKYIVLDESSMVSDALLDEIKKYMMPTAKIIYMADKAQLPPPGQENDSKVFNNTNKYELTEKMRQAKTSPIINIGTKVAANVETTNENRKPNVIENSDRQNIFDEESGSSILFEKNTDKALDNFIEDFNKNPTDVNNVKIVTFNNQNHNSPQSVKNLNNQVRQKLFGDKASTQFLPGELVTSYGSYSIDSGQDIDETIIQNSEDFIVDNARETSIASTAFAYSNAKGQRRFDYNYNIVALTLKNDDGIIVEHEIPVIANSSKEKYRKDLAELWNTDKGLAIALQNEFADIEYGYAITSHKAQGSTYNTVYVMEDNILGPSNGGSIKSKNQSLYVAVSRPKNKLVMVSENNPTTQKLKILPKQKEPKQEAKTTTNNPKEFTNYSGAAKGSDTEWENIGKEYGIGKQVNFVTNTYDKLSDIQKEEVENAYKKTVKKLNRVELSLTDPNSKKVYGAKLVRRDYLQAKAADSIFAIIEGFDKNNLPKGGTAYATMMAIDMKKPVHIFNQEDKTWYEAKYTEDGNFYGFEQSGSIPVLTPKFAGIGTREINDSGKQAIKDVYENTFNNTESQKTAVKLGITEIFETNPELSKLGTEQQYSQYLDSVFPNSQVKDIVYHGTDKVFDSFKTFVESNVEGVFYTYNKNSAKVFGKAIPVLANSIKPLIEKDSILYDSISKEAKENLIKNYDSVITPNEMGVVFEPEQMHILGSKQDIEGFKEFVGNKKTAVEQPAIKQVADGIKVIENVISKSEELELFNELKPYLEAQGSRTNKGNSAPIMIGLGLRWDYTSNNPGKTPIELGETINNSQFQKNKYRYYNVAHNGQPLGNISQNIKDLVTKATGIDATNYDGAIINVYPKNGFISAHNDVDESVTAIKYPVLVLNIGGDGSLSVEGSESQNSKKGYNEKQYTDTKLNSGDAYIFGEDGKNRDVFHRTLPSSVKGTLPELNIQGDIIPANSYRITITLRRVKPLEKGMSESPAKLESQKTAVGQPTYYEGNIKPEPNTVFVFGSNPEGRHGAGAAKIAREQFGAIYGQGEGLQGNAYALPTKDLRIKENKGFKSISSEDIIKNIKKLYEVAIANPTKQFKIGYRNTNEISLNGYTGVEMIDMFKQAGTIPSNIIFSKEWVDTGLLNNTEQSNTQQPIQQSNTRTITTIRKESLVSTEKDEKGNDIEETLTGYMNAIVDMVKNPEVINQSNLNLYTASTAFLLARAGVDRDWTTVFLKQPILVDLVNQMNISESRISQKLKGSDGETLKALDIILKKYGSTKSGREFKEGILKDNLRNEDGFVTITEKELRKEFINPNNEIQIKVLKQFLEYQTKGFTLADLMTVMSADTDGATKNGTTADMRDNLMMDVIAGNEFTDLPSLLGYDLDKNNKPIFNDTRYIGTYHKNSVQLLQKIAKQKFISSSDSFKHAVNTIARYSGHKKLKTKNDEELVKNIENELFAGFIEESKIVSFNDIEDLKTLLYGNKSKIENILQQKEKDLRELATYKKQQGQQLNTDDVNYFNKVYDEQIAKLPKDKTLAERVLDAQIEHPDNLFLAALLPNQNVYNNGKPSTVSLSSKNIDKESKDDLYLYWEDLLNIDKKLGEDLIKYSYYSSGFSPNLGVFFEHIPTSWVIENKLNDYIKGKLTTLNETNMDLLHLKDQVVRHSYKNNSIVPTISDKMLTEFKMSDGGIVPSLYYAVIQDFNASNLEIGENKYGQKEYKTFIKRIYTEPNTNETFTYLYQYKGYGLNKNSESKEIKHLLYERVSPLGTTKGINVIKEYGNNGESIFAENKVTIPPYYKDYVDKLKLIEPLPIELLHDSFDKKDNVNEEPNENDLMYCNIKIN